MKHLIIAILAVMMIAGSEMAHSSGLSGLMAAVEQSMPILERLASADETDLAVHCAGNHECVEGMRRDVKVLGQALDLLNGQASAFQGNRVAVEYNERLLSIAE